MAKKFQSTHPHGVRHDAFRRWSNIRRFQSTHPHGVRLLGPYLDYPFVACFNPRTHTGCDNGIPLRFQMFYVSIHAPTRGATLSITTQQWHCRVSIHAPTRGATLTKPLFCKTVSFQSTHPHGVRRGLKEAISCFEEFQSTHPHGVRRDNAFILQGQDEFQSTHPHGVRHSSSKNVGW